MKNILKTTAIAIALVSGVDATDSKQQGPYDCAKYAAIGATVAVVTYQGYTWAWSSTGENISLSHNLTSSVLTGAFGALFGAGYYCLNQACGAFVNLGLALGRRK